MPSQVQIWNMALARCGQTQPVSSIEEDSKPAKLCGMFYPTVVDALLERFDWSFARRRATLVSPVDVTPPTEWQFAYLLPADCIAPRLIANGYRINPVDEDIPFTMEDRPDPTNQSPRRILFTDQPSAILRYTARMDNPGRFTPTFTDAVAWALAAEISYGLQVEGREEQRIRERAVMALSMAMAADANAQVPDPEPDAESIRARL